jgi:predicted nucleic acid-binding protein
MTRYVLDTSFVIDHLRGDSAATARFARLFNDGDEAMINEVVACEAWTGAPQTGDPALEALIRAVEFVQPGPESARRAGEWREAARARGHVLSLSDALIAAAADDVNAAVLTRNVRDFALTPVRIETY